MNSWLPFISGAPQSYNKDSMVVVNASGTDEARGAALHAAYETAKALTPNGTTRSATNRVTIILPVGAYKVNDTLTLDTDFIDIYAQFPLSGGEILPGEVVQEVDEGDGTGMPMSQFKPSPTLIYTEVDRIDTVRQECENLRLFGFSIAQLSIWSFADVPNTGLFDVPGAFKIGDVDNTESFYDTMYFWSRIVGNGVCHAVSTYRHCAGVWNNCIAGPHSWVVGKGSVDMGTGESDALDGIFSAQMTNCQGGIQSFIGDPLETVGWAGKASGCRLINCRVTGMLVTIEGYGGFSGCGAVANEIDATCYFENCTAGDYSFAFSSRCLGTFVNCVGGKYSFGGIALNNFPTPARFGGTARNCRGGEASFGGRTSNSDATPGDAKCTGTLINCEIIGNTRPLNLEGATLRGCRLTNVTTGQAGFRLLDSNSSVTNSDIIVFQGGTGVPFINNGTAKNVKVAHCRMNNATNDADGMGASVTNLIGTHYNVIDDDLT